MRNATAVNAVMVLSEQPLPDGVTLLEVDCRDYDAFRTLPEVVEYSGRLFGRTGWNSDIGLGYYRDDCRIARAR